MGLCLVRLLVIGTLAKTKEPCSVPQKETGRLCGGSTGGGRYFIHLSCKRMVHDVSTRKV